jgi:UDP-N-acetyl-D-glucosamine dehydrogenase
MSSAAARLKEEEGSAKAALLQAIETRTATIGIIGLGYVGIPLALTTARAGFRVLGFDINAPRVAQINRGESFIRHIPRDAVGEAIEQDRFEATADFARLDEPDAVLICVPTPLTRYREPDLSFVVKTTEAIAARLRPGQLVVLESTTYPGTTEEVLKPILNRAASRAASISSSPSRRSGKIPGTSISAPAQSRRSSAATGTTRSRSRRRSTTRLSRKRSRSPPPRRRRR